jgi:hypothetical protein
MQRERVNFRSQVDCCKIRISLNPVDRRRRLERAKINIRAERKLVIISLLMPLQLLCENAEEEKIVTRIDPYLLSFKEEKKQFVITS